MKYKMTVPICRLNFTSGTAIYFKNKNKGWWEMQEPALWLDSAFDDPWRQGQETKPIWNGQEWWRIKGDPNLLLK